MTAIFRQEREMLGASQYKSNGPLDPPEWGCPHFLVIPKTRVTGWNWDGRALVAIPYIVNGWMEQPRRCLGQLSTEVDLGQAVLRYAACLGQPGNQRPRRIAVDLQNVRLAWDATCVLD